MRGKVLILILMLLGYSCPVFADIEKVQTLLVNGDLTGAGQHCREILGGNPSKSVQEQALFYLATINLKQNKYADCRHNFNLLIHDFPESKLLNRARLGIADSYFFEGNYSLAEKIYAELLAGKDKSVAPTVYARLIDLYLKQGDRDKTQDCLNKLHSKYPLSFEAGLIKDLPKTVSTEETKEVVSRPEVTETNQDFFTPLETGRQRRPSGIFDALSLTG